MTVAFDKCLLTVLYGAFLYCLVHCTVVCTFIIFMVLYCFGNKILRCSTDLCQNINAEYNYEFSKSSVCN